MHALLLLLLLLLPNLFVSGEDDAERNHHMEREKTQNERLRPCHGGDEFFRRPYQIDFLRFPDLLLDLLSNLPGRSHCICHKDQPSFYPSCLWPRLANAFVYLCYLCFSRSEPGLRYLCKDLLEMVRGTIESLAETHDSTHRAEAVQRSSVCKLHQNRTGYARGSWILLRDLFISSAMVHFPFHFPPLPPQFSPFLLLSSRPAYNFPAEDDRARAHPLSALWIRRTVMAGQFARKSTHPGRRLSMPQTGGREGKKKRKQSSSRCATALHGIRAQDRTDKI